MPIYYVEMDVKQSGDHELHTHNCRYLPVNNKKIQLGYFSDCKDAMEKAKEFYKNVHACKFCSWECIT